MMPSDALAEGSRESRRDDKTQGDLVARWLAEIELAGKSEEDWRKDAAKATDIYRAEGEQGKDQRFNILFSNIQTEVPSMYSSTPSPDVRTRYSAEDEAARLTCQTIERLLSYSIDVYDFDGTIKAAVQDRQLAGRGTVRVRYKPMVYQDQVYQEVICEHVPWKSIRLGPATHWETMPWIAFEHFLTRSQLEKLAPEIGGGIELNMSLKGEGDEIKAAAAPNVYKRTVVWEIWDRQTGKVFWIATSYKAAPIRVDDEPLGLTGFYPIPEPMYAVKNAGNMVPVCPYRIIAPLVEELEDITVRIQTLIRAIRWRGFKHPALPGFERMSEAEDGELVDASEEVLSLVTAGGIDKFVWLMPIDQAIKTVQELYVQREQIKATIFEVSGLSDILRGQSNPNETLGAQEIKANFGSMRMQDGQRDVQRFCRDLFRLKAEIACNLFDSQNLKMQTGMDLPSRQEVQQARAQIQKIQMQVQMQPAMGHNGGPPMGGAPEIPSEIEELANATAWEDVLELIKSGATRTYRIDVETDSTIRGETGRIQQNAAQFVQGVGTFVQAFAPLVESGTMPGDVAVDLLSSLMASFKLGKKAEDAMQRWAHEATEKAKNPPPPQPSPEEIKAQTLQKQAEIKGQQDAQKHQATMQQIQVKAQADAAKMQGDQQKQAADLHFKAMSAQLDIEKQQREMEMDAVAQEREFAFRARDADLSHAVENMRAQTEMTSLDKRLAHDERNMALKEQMAQRKAEREALNPRRMN